LSEKIGFIGLGKMGLPMAANLLNNGYTVYGNDLDADAIKEFIFLGGRQGQIKDWINDIQYLILMLPSSSIVNQVIEEILFLCGTAKITSNLTIMDMSSSYPSSTMENGKKLVKQNIRFIDAPVSGGVKKAITGELTIMAGGELQTFENCKRLLNHLGKNIFHTGPLGSGHFIKALNNYLSATHLLATSEAVQLIEHFGVKKETAINIFNESTGRSGSTDYKFPEFILNERYDSGFSMELLAKDLEMAKDLFIETGASTTLPETIYETYKNARKLLPRESDHTEIYQYVSEHLLNRGNNDEKNEKAFSDNADSAFNV
jgi:3-hydroxyisobutyrate dehydrogenase-like beta-hydroxyacid dehydrogenase